MNGNSKASSMLKRLSVLIIPAAGLLLTASLRAQDTNLCASLVMTRLEAAQTNIGRVTIRATFPVGTILARTGSVTVNCKEITDIPSGQKDQGIAITVTEGEQSTDIALIDYDELDPLLDALDYLNKVDWSVTTLSSFDAFYTTKDGFRMAAFSSRRTGIIEFVVRTLRYNQRPVFFARDQVAQFRTLIQQAKAKLDSVRPAK